MYIHAYCISNMGMINIYIIHTFIFGGTLEDNCLPKVTLREKKVGHHCSICICLSFYIILASVEFD